MPDSFIPKGKPAYLEYVQKVTTDRLYLHMYVHENKNKLGQTPAVEMFMPFVPVPATAVPIMQGRGIKGWVARSLAMPGTARPGVSGMS